MTEYRGLRIPVIIEADDGCYGFEDGYFYHINYGTQPKNDPSALIQLDLFNIVDRKYIRLGVPFCWKEFNELGIKEANKLLLERAKNRIDSYYHEECKKKKNRRKNK